MKPLNDEAYMRLALQMAEQAQGQTGVNPVVGCVIVKNGRIVGLGSHLKAGTPHAEIHALQMAGSEAEGSTVYVTLEPCSHFGRTPPCSDRLVKEKVKRVVIASIDPNPKVAGTGIRKLRKHGIQVDVGVLEREAVALNEAFNKFIVTHRPFVTLKTAGTLDGKIATHTGDSKWITNEQSREFVHSLRHKHEAIMVGVETVIADNPELTTRLTVPGLNPARIVVDSRLRTPEEAHLIQHLEAKTILLCTSQADQEKKRRFEALGVEVVLCGDGPQVDLGLAMKLLGEREISSVLLEGGGRLNGAMLQAGLIDKMYLFYAPKIVGGWHGPSNFMFAGVDEMKDAYVLERLKVETFGDNLCIIGYPRNERGD